MLMLKKWFKNIYTIGHIAQLPKKHDKNDHNSTSKQAQVLTDVMNHLHIDNNLHFGLRPF